MYDTGHWRGLALAMAQLMWQYKPDGLKARAYWLSWTYFEGSKGCFIASFQFVAVIVVQSRAPLFHAASNQCKRFAFSLQLAPSYERTAWADRSAFRKSGRQFFSTTCSVSSTVIWWFIIGSERWPFATPCTCTLPWCLFLLIVLWPTAIVCYAIMKVMARP